MKKDKTFLITCIIFLVIGIFLFIIKDKYWIFPIFIIIIYSIIFGLIKIKIKIIEWEQKPVREGTLLYKMKLNYQKKHGEVKSN